MNEALAKYRNQVKQYQASLPYVKVLFGEKPILFATPNEKCSNFALSINEREPRTNAWIKDFRKDDIFFDIGANNGIYSIMAAVVSGCTVYAFEPHFGSYYVMSLNIYANQLQNQIFAYPLAISNRFEFGSLFLSDTYAGKSLNNYGNARPHDNPLWNATIPQAAISTSIDDFAAAQKIVPTHIKIDVDGIEHLIVDGAVKTLGNSALKSVMVEIDDKNQNHRNIFNIMSQHGFTRQEMNPAGVFFFRD